jgi:hypothetical protein
VMTNLEKSFNIKRHVIVGGQAHVVYGPV